MATTFEKINEGLVCTKVKSKTDALALRDEAKETAQSGKSVVIFFNGRYHLHIAPGQDPYQTRKDIEAYLNPPKEKTQGSDEAISEDEEKPEVKKGPQRDSSGKFVSKKHSVSEEEASPKDESSKKKGFFRF